MEDGVAFLENSGVLSQVRDLGIATTHWEQAVSAFRSGFQFIYIICSRAVAEQFDAYAVEVAANRPELLRLINDQVKTFKAFFLSLPDIMFQMRGFERNFLLAEGLPDRIQYRHVVGGVLTFDLI